MKNKNKLKLAYNPKIMQELLDQPGVRENVAQMKPETLEWFKESLHPGAGLFCQTKPARKYHPHKSDERRQTKPAQKMSAKRRGENSNTSKLTWEQVDEIRSRYIPRKVSQRQLANEFGVDQQVIWAIVNRNTWRDK